jgi:hypothetical protein
LAKKDTFLLLRLYYYHTHTHTPGFILFFLISAWLLLFLFPSTFSLRVYYIAEFSRHKRARAFSFIQFYFFTFRPVSREREIREYFVNHADNTVIARCVCCVCWGVYPSPCRRHTTTRKNKQWNVHSFIYTGVAILSCTKKIKDFPVRTFNTTKKNLMNY